MTDLDKLIQLSSADLISDELLAAYIDGNTTADENAFIESSVPMEELNDISELVADSQYYDDELHIYDSDDRFWEPGMQPAMDVNDNLSDINTPTTDVNTVIVDDPIIVQHDPYVDHVESPKIDVDGDDINDIDTINT